MLHCGGINHDFKTCEQGRLKKHSNILYNSNDIDNLLFIECCYCILLFKTTEHMEHIWAPYDSVKFQTPSKLAKCPVADSMDNVLCPVKDVNNRPSHFYSTCETVLYIESGRSCFIYKNARLLMCDASTPLMSSELVTLYFFYKYLKTTEACAQRALSIYLECFGSWFQRRSIIITWTHILSRDIARSFMLRHLVHINQYKIIDSQNVIY